MTASFDVVIPSAGRETLTRLLSALWACGEPRPQRVLIVDDRPSAPGPLDLGPAGHEPVQVIRGPARGPAAARNAGWYASGSEWVAFLDDDVVAPAGWTAALACDLAGLDVRTAASQGRIEVPLPEGRPATDSERNTKGLEQARWATADMAFRRSALSAVGGFDERFPRAYREDADLGLRLIEAGYTIERGARHVVHPVRAADPWASVRLQAGNADDVLMRRLHGPGWRERAGASRGRLSRHLATAGAGLAGAAAAVAGRRRPAIAGAALWLAGTGELAWRRIAPGPRTPAEVATMVLTSIAIPPAAALHWGRATLAARRAAPVTRKSPRRAPEAVLLDRDGTLVEDVPYNGDPSLVRPMPGARQALERLRASGVKLAVVSNQSGVGRGLISESEMQAVNSRVEDLLGPLGPWLICPHAPDDPCECRKPGPGLVLQAAEALGVAPERCAVVGDIGTDVDAARAAGARGILVPTAVTRKQEIEAAPETAANLPSAVEMLIGGGT